MKSTLTLPLLVLLLLLLLALYCVATKPTVQLFGETDQERDAELLLAAEQNAAQAVALFTKGHIVDASAAYDDATKLCDRMHNRKKAKTMLRNIAEQLEEGADSLNMEDQFSNAMAYQTMAADIYHDTGDHQLADSLLISAVHHYMSQAEKHEANEEFALAKEIYHNAANACDKMRNSKQANAKRCEIAKQLAGMARECIAHHDFSSASGYYERAVGLYRKAGSNRKAENVLFTATEYFLASAKELAAKSKPYSAITAYREAANICDKMRNSKQAETLITEVAQSFGDYVGRLHDRNQIFNALDCYPQAATLYRMIGDMQQAQLMERAMQSKNK